MTLLQRIELHAREHPAKPALTGLDTALSYRELLASVQQWTDWLLAQRIPVLAIALDNTPDWVILDLAAYRARVCLVPIPPFFSAQQMQHALRQSGASALITDNPAAFQSIDAELLQYPPQQLTLTGKALSLFTHAAIDSKVTKDILKITYTSGTTGEPKGVMLHQQQIETVIASLVESVNPIAEDRHLSLMPLAVLLENLAGVYVALWAGANVILPGLAAVGLRGAVGLDSEKFSRLLAQIRPTTLIITPQLLPLLIALKQARPGLLDSLRFIALGGAPVSETLLIQAEALELPVYEGYGLSECASVTTLNTQHANRRGSVGKPLPHIQIRISAQGEVLIEGHRFAGYLGQASDTVNQTWHSGDLGYLDENGYLFLTGRLRNVFITAMGRNVSPEWIERELVLAPEILQAAVFGEARASNTAVIVAKDGTDTQALWRAIEKTNARLPDYARISHLVIAGEPFTPHNGQLSGTGRNRREVIRDTYRDTIEQCYLQEQFYE